MHTIAISFYCEVHAVKFINCRFAFPLHEMGQALLDTLAASIYALVNSIQAKSNFRFHVMKRERERL